MGLLPFRLREKDLIRLETPVATMVFSIAVQDEAVLPGRGIDPVAVIGTGRVEVEDEKVPRPLECEDLVFVVLMKEARIP
jgi:hypothetical protein